MKQLKMKSGAKITPEDYLDLHQWLSHQGRDCPCEYGHRGCAAWDKGPCIDELLQTYPELNDN